jgi:hypothetical protein
VGEKGAISPLIILRGLKVSFCPLPDKPTIKIFELS